MWSVILLVAGLAALSVAIWYDVHGMRLSSSLFAVIGAVLMFMGAVAAPAHGHDHARPQLDGWFKGLTSGKGPCCDGSDATHLADVDWQSKDGHYRVRIEGEWYDVPDDAVLPGPNLDGRTLVWPIKGWGGMTIRCFMPGTMT